jgi:hypothetical protein
VKIRTLLSVLVLCQAACTHATRPSGGTPDLRYELVSLTGMRDGQAVATFRVVNEGDGALVYLGHTPEGPIYQCEVREGGVWEPNPLGWCGTGLVEQCLRPGASFEFTTAVPGDGREYRFGIGEAPAWTPEVSTRSLGTTSQDPAPTGPR